MVAPVLLVGCLLMGQSDGSRANDLSPAVHRLVRQLDAPQLAQRDAAERELLALGPDALEALPSSDARLPAEAQQRLSRIRRAFERMRSELAAAPSRVTLKADAMPLLKCLEEIARQTGNRIIDYREQFGQEKTDPMLQVDFDKMPFWQALGQVLDQAKMMMYPFGPERAVYVVARPAAAKAENERVILAGPLRFEPQEFIARRELGDPMAASLQLKTLVAWEPRLAPISLRQSLAKVKATDSRGRLLTMEGSQAVLEVPVDPTATAVELTLPMVLPPRTTTEIAKLTATLDAMLPGRVETFRFDKLTEAANVEKRVAGVTVVLEQVRKTNEIWEVWVRVRFDHADTALESHRGWVFNNPAYLEGPEGKRINHDGYETTRRTEDEIGLTYLFAIENPPTNLTFVYQTPSAILSVAFPYEFKNLPLP